MKNRLRKMLSLVLAAVIAMSAISVNTLAATIMNIANGSNQKLYVDWYGYSYNFNGRLNTSTYGQIIKYITATCADGIYTYNGDSTSEFRYTLKNSTFAIAELPTGDYTVTEYNNARDYSPKQQTQKIKITKNTAAELTFTNVRDTGTGKIIKVWKQFDTMTATEQAEIENNVYFTVTDSNGAYLKVKGNSGSYIYCGSQKTETKFVLKNGTFAIAELPTGDYTVTEYNNAKDYSPKQQTQKIKVVRNQTAKATFVNERDTGNASIVKKWTNPNGLTTAQKAELEKNVYFTVKNADGAYLNAVSKNGKYVYNGSQTAEARFMLTNGKFELTELPTGKYTITEISNAEGYLPKTQVKTITVTKDAKHSQRHLSLKTEKSTLIFPHNHKNAVSRFYYERSYNNFISCNYNTGIPHSPSEKRNYQARYCR